MSFRRLDENGGKSDWNEKVLAHETNGIRGVYCLEQHLDQHWEIRQWWANFVDRQIDEGRCNVIIGRFGKAYRAACA